jgi:hypothetical protein
MSAADDADDARYFGVTPEELAQVDTSLERSRNPDGVPRGELMVTERLKLARGVRASLVQYRQYHEPRFRDEDRAWRCLKKAREELNRLIDLHEGVYGR